MRPRPLRRHPASGAFNPIRVSFKRRTAISFIGQEAAVAASVRLSALVPSRLPAIINREGGEMAHGSGYILCR